MSEEPDGQGSFLEPPPPRPMGIREYARHKGVSAPTVLRAIEAGRLKASIVRVRKGGKDNVPQIANVALADQEWDRNTDLTTAPTYVKEREPGAAAPTAATPPAIETPAPASPTTEATGPKDDGEEEEIFLGMPLSKAAAAEKVFRAKNEELKYLERIGELVEAKAFEQAFVGLVIAARTKLLGVPSKFKGRRPTATFDDIRVLDELIRESLTELSVPPTVTKAPGETVETSNTPRAFELEPMEASS